MYVYTGLMIYILMFYCYAVRAIDGDRGVNNPITYSLLNEGELFGVDSQSGIVYTKGVLDREDEKGGSYILQLLVSSISGFLVQRSDFKGILRLAACGSFLVFCWFWVRSPESKYGTHTELNSTHLIMNYEL